MRLLVDILGVNHKIILHGCGEEVRVWLELCHSVVVWDFRES